MEVGLRVPDILILYDVLFHVAANRLHFVDRDDDTKIDAVAATMDHEATSSYKPRKTHNVIMHTSFSIASSHKMSSQKACRNAAKP